MAELETELNQPSESEKRIKDLSSKVKETSEERDKERQAREEAEKKAQEAQVERDFFANFADTVSTNPAAKDHKDEILSKVKSGYTVEDATFAVLGKAGKLNTPAPAVQSPAGGSAVITPPQGGSKPVSEMTTAEKRQALLDAQERGDISLT